MFKKVDPKRKYSEMEKDLVKFWKENQTFEKSVEQRSKDKMYSFYDGPPFITGVPHHGTLLSSIVKDCMPRYWTMKGYRVERRWGWDCHGLPAENMVEKKLGIKSKKEIEKVVGIEKFNQTCFAMTSKIASDWEKIVDRIGRWVEFKGAYKTMDKTYMESVWWAFKELYEKDLIYEDVRISLYCPRCSTPLANFEIAMDNSYEEDTDTAVFVKMELDSSPDEESQASFAKDEKTYFLVWTTVPWTILANVALAINEKMTYTMVKHLESKEVYVLAKERLDVLGQEDQYEIIQEFKGTDLIGLHYKPVYHQSEVADDEQKAYVLISEDYVTSEDGTGIVSTAPAFGEEDFEARKKNGLPLALIVDEEGRLTEGKWQGEKVWEANDKIVEWLEKEGILFKKEKFTHKYPHCHRCHAKLIYKAQPAWFLAIDKIRKKLIKNNEKIFWHPTHFKEGRFKKGIEGAPDWNISRDRYWGTAMPVWKCHSESVNQKPESGKNGASNSDGCGNIKVVGSYEELKKLSGAELDDYHRPYIDEVTFPCEKCGGTMKRIPQVLDCWVESGSMPYAQFHYPFENKEKFEKSFPTDFIAEYVGQVRAWFYVLHVMATGVFDKESFKNVIVTGNIAGEDGRKMSKSFGNFTDPDEILENYSADALRFYMLSSPLLNGQDVSFSEATIKDIQRRVLGTLWNSYSFFTLYASVDKWSAEKLDVHEVHYRENLLDRWILSELHKLIKSVDENMQKYDIVTATKPIDRFINNLSNWYIRRSRRRFWKSENDSDKEDAYQTLWTVLAEFSKVLAPFCPFVADEIYRNLTGDESVHLVDFSESNDELIDEELSQNMEMTRKIIELGLSLRADNGIKVRQPLDKLSIVNCQLTKELLGLIEDEVNVKSVELTKKEDKNLKWKAYSANGAKEKDKKELKVGLDINIDEELQLEGQMRELVRHIQSARKEAGFEVDDRIELWYQGGSDIFQKFEKEIAREVLAEKIYLKKPSEDIFNKDIKIDNIQLTVWLKKQGGGE